MLTMNKTDGKIEIMGGGYALLLTTLLLITGYLVEQLELWLGI